jgi:hypothetical protein
LRGKVDPVVTPGIDPAQVDMMIALKDGGSCIASSRTRSAASKFR